jgi:hypothetical protein
MALDLEAMRSVRRGDVQREQVKTFLSPTARARVKAAANFVGCHEYEILEELAMTLPRTTEEAD